MKCANCPTGILSRNKKPDALGRIIEKCDACDYRRTISGDELVVAPLSGSLTNVRGRATANHVVSTPAPVASVDRVNVLTLTPVVGQPCPCCGQKVKPMRMCIQCRTRPALFHKRRCGVCRPPRKRLPSRFCVECGEKYERQVGDPPSAAFRCPKHRKEKAA